LKKESMTSIVRIVIIADSPQRLREIIAQEDLDLNCGGAIHAPTGEWKVEAYTSPEIADRLRQSGHRVEIDTQFEERASERQSDVATGDRFQGGRVRPSGRGKKE
jgi:hypothetical protein